MSTSTVLETETKIKTKEIKLWQVIMLNDDFTPIGFVVSVLMQMFNKSENEAMAIAENIHEKGRGIAGIYTKEISMQKSSDACNVARQHGHPLTTVAEEQ